MGTAGFAEVARKAAQGRADLVGRGLNPEGRKELRLFSTWEITKYLIPVATPHFRRVLKAHPERRDSLRRALDGVGSAEAQAAVLTAFVAGEPAVPVAPVSSSGVPERREKFEFRVGLTKVTARKGECRILSPRDFSELPRDRLERAIRAFEAELDD